MILRTLAAMLAGGSALSAAVSAWAGPEPPPIKAHVTIDYEIPGNPIFQDTTLGGDVGLWAFGNFDGPRWISRGGSSFAALGDGHTFKTSFSPTDPCFGLSQCDVGFSYSGNAGQFPAEAFPPNVPPNPIIPPDPIVPLFTLIPGNPVIPPNPIVGPIFAWDDPVQVGTWSVTISAAPEPASWALMLIGAAGLGATLRRRARRVTAATE